MESQFLDAWSGQMKTTVRPVTWLCVQFQGRYSSVLTLAAKAHIAQYSLLQYSVYCITGHWSCCIHTQHMFIMLHLVPLCDCYTQLVVVQSTERSMLVTVGPNI